MLKDNWEDKHGINLPAHPSCSNNNDHLSGSSSKTNTAALTSSFQDGRFDLPISQPTSTSTYQNRFSESSVDSNMQELIKILSTNYGPKKTPLEKGTPEYMKLLEILKQSSVKEMSGGLKETDSSSKDRGTNDVNTLSLTCINSQEKTSYSEKAAEQLWEGSLQLSSSVTLSAVAFFKSGEKLVINNWPEFIEVKGKVRLEAFEKYVQDLPRSRNRGLMVISICWNEASSNIGLNGMKEVATGYKKSSRVGFAQLLSGIDLYICPRSDPIITILAKYGFFKGMSVINDKPDSMIGCVVWRKNRPLNPVGNADVQKISNLNPAQNSPPGFSSKRAPDKKLSPQTAESGQCDELLTLPLTTTCADVDHTGGSSSASSSPCGLVLKKRPFEDNDLPEFDFGVSCKKSTLVSKPLDSPKQLEDSLPTQLPTVMNGIPRENGINGFSKQTLKKTKLFDDDMPEWRPPEPNNHLPPQITASNFQNSPFCPTPLFPPPLPRADTGSSFSFQPFRPLVTSQPPLHARPPPPQLLPPSPPRLPQPPQPTSQPPVFSRPTHQQQLLPPPPPTYQLPVFARSTQHQQPLPPSTSQPLVSSRPTQQQQLLPPPPPTYQLPIFARPTQHQQLLPPPPPTSEPPASARQLPPPLPASGRFNNNQVLLCRPLYPSLAGRRPQL